MREQTLQMSEEKRSEAAPTIDLFRGWEFTHNPKNKEIGEIKRKIREICEICER